MTPESWAEVRDVLFIPGLANAPFHKLDDPLYTVGWIIKYQLQQYREQILEIALKAAKEADLKRQLEEVKEFWRTANLNVAPYKGRTDVFILDTKANEDLISRLDDTMLKGNNILGSRFVEGIRTEVEEQMRMLRYTQELLDEWYSHQRNWTYLEPILSSQYAQKNMAKEVKAFSVADVAWKKMMKRANDLPALLKYWAAVDF
jgi:dynein heavy chain